MPVVKKEKNVKTNEYWYSIIAKNFVTTKDGQWIKTSIPVMVKPGIIKTSKDGKYKYFRINEKNLGKIIFTIKDKNEKDSKKKESK